jgi:predicted alpha/beta-hydrolase family hydrolase
MTLETLTFVGAGGAPLSAVIHRPEGPAKGSILMAHCFTCSKDLHTSTRLAKSLAAAGWITFSFDFTGLGESEGDFAESTVSTDIGDLSRAAVAMLERRIGPCLILGHSLGGAAAVLVASRLHTVDAVICVATPAEVGHIRNLLPNDAGLDGKSFSICVGGRPFDLSADFLDDLDRHDVIEAARDLGRPVLVIEAGDDAVVGRDQTRALADAAGAEIAVVEGADHLFTAPAHAVRLSEIVVEWATRHAAG